MPTSLDYSQAIQGSYDETNQALRIHGVTGSLVNVTYDYIGASYPNPTTETYVYKTGGASGTTVATVTVVYTDASKADLSSVTKS